MRWLSLQVSNLIGMPFQVSQELLLTLPQVFHLFIHTTHVIKFGMISRIFDPVKLFSLKCAKVAPLSIPAMITIQILQTPNERKSITAKRRCGIEIEIGRARDRSRAEKKEAMNEDAGWRAEEAGRRAREEMEWKLSTAPSGPRHSFS